MPLPDMPKRLIPFPLVLVAVTGTFVLVALYADVRGREKRAAETPATPVVQETPESSPTPEPAAATSTDEQPVEQPTPMPLGLAAEIPTSDVPAAAVFDCWRYEWRGDRMVADRDHRDLGSKDVIPRVTSETLHLACPDPGVVIRSPSGNVTLFWSGNVDQPPEDLPGTIPPGTIYRVNALTGVLDTVVRLENTETLTGYAFAGFSSDEQTVWLTSEYAKGDGPGAHLFRIDLATGAAQRSLYAPIWHPLLLTPDRSRAVGFEWTATAGDEGGARSPVYLHRINLETGQRVRVGQLPDDIIYIPSASLRPVFIDDQRLVVPGRSGAWVVQIYSGKRAPLAIRTSSLDLLSLSADGQTLFVSGTDLPVTAIPVAELPKP